MLRLCCLLLLTLLAPACRPAAEVFDVTPAIMFDFPLRGEWRLLRSPGHDAFAYDLAAAEGPDARLLRRSRWQHLLGRTTVEDSYSWGQVVHAPGSAEVIAASDGWPDRMHLHLIRDATSMLFSRPQLEPEDIRAYAGNYLILRVDTVYVFLAHLRSGSLAVAAGDTVVSGQPLAQVGNSGQTLEPHLHLEVFDQVHDLLGARTLPFRIREFERWTGQAWEPQRNAALIKGERVRYRPTGAAPAEHRF